jgi:hypothetical protein
MSGWIYFFFFWTGNSIYWWAWLRRGKVLMLSWVQGPPIVQGTTLRGVFNPTVILDEPLFCHHVFRFILIKLRKSSLLGDVDLLAARKFELGPAEGFNHMLLVRQLGGDGHYDLANVSFPKAPDIPVWSLSAPAQDNILLMRITWKGWNCTRMWKPSLPQLFARQTRGLQRRAAHIHLTPCGHRQWELIHVCLLMPEVENGHLGRSGTLGTAYSYNTGNTRQGGDPWQHQDLQWSAKGKSPNTFLKH